MVDVDRQADRYRQWVRDSVPLPGVTPAQVLSQLAHRLFGPLRPSRTRIVLDYHGLLGRPAGRVADIARRHHVTAPTVRNNVAAVRAAGARTPLSPLLVVEAQRTSTPAEDHLGRIRIAAALGLAPPGAAVRDDGAPSTNDGPKVPLSQLAIGRAGRRILIAVGPLPLPAIAAALARSRRFRERNPLSDNELTDALRGVGCAVDDAGLWHAPAGSVPSDLDRFIVTRAAGQELTRSQMIKILIDAGYSRSSAEGRMSSSHPLFQRTGPDLYGLIGDS